MKKPHIQIHDSKKRKGELFIRYVAANGKKLAHSETLSSVANVNKNLGAMLSSFAAGSGKVNNEEFFLLVMLNVFDHTRNQHWTKKYGCKSGLKQSKSK